MLEFNFRVTITYTSEGEWKATTIGSDSRTVTSSDPWDAFAYLANLTKFEMDKEYDKLAHSFVCKCDCRTDTGCRRRLSFVFAPTGAYVERINSDDVNSREFFTYEQLLEILEDEIYTNEREHVRRFSSSPFAEGMTIDYWDWERLKRFIARGLK